MIQTTFARLLIASIASSGLLGGCATAIPGDPSRLTAEQLSALAKDKSATIGCSTAQTLTGSVTTIYAQIDSARQLGGTVEIGADCSVRLRTGER